MEPFKEQLNLKNAEIIGKSIKEHYPDFNIKLFRQKLANVIPNLELKQRIQLIAKVLVELLPPDPKITFPILVKASKNLTGFKSWPLNDIVVILGMKNVVYSLETLIQLTSQFSAEFAIRPFLIQFENETLHFLRKNLNHQCHHVRRLISEGTRPLLPWGEQIPSFKKNPQLTWDLLETLKNDESEYVRKSVANHLNDHSKHHAPWLIKKLQVWNKSSNSNLNWIVKHGLRTLIKKGDSQALKLIGIQHSAAEILSIKLSRKSIRLNETQIITYKIKNLTNRSQEVIIDQKLYLLRANKKISEKVFKGRKIQLSANTIIEGSLNLVLKPVTTRNYYSGNQFYSLLINGKESKKIGFALNCD